MRMRTAVAAYLVLVGLAACAPADQPTDTSGDELALRELIAQTAAANNSADTLGWVGLFEPGAVYMPPGAPAVTTRAGLEQMAAAGFGPYAAAVEITPVEIVIVGDWAFARSDVTGAVTPRAGGEPIAVDVKQLVIYHKQPSGEWMISRLITNQNK